MESTQKSFNKIYQKAFYTDEKLPILKVKKESNLDIVDIENIVIPPNRIHKKNDIQYLIFDTSNNEKSLFQYIKEKETLNSDELIKIIYRIGILIKTLNENNYLLGSIDLEDFWMIDNKIDNLFIRQRKSFLKEDEESLKNIMLDYECSEICTLAVKRKQIQNINKKLDIELYGKIFMKLVIPNRSITSYKELRYLSYNLKMFVNDFPVELYSWVNRITDMYDESYNDINDVIEDMQNILKDIEVKPDENQPKFKYLYSCISHPGKGKISTLSEEKLKVIDNINQDSVYLKLQNECLFAMVADGVSNCMYGTGYKASNIVRNVCEYTFLNGLYFIKKSNIYNLYRKIVNKSNKQICKNVKLSLSEKELNHHIIRDIMASTFASCFIYKNKLFYTSIGDSRIFLYRNKNVTPLNIEDNLGNTKLKENILWNDYKEMQSKSSLTKFIGKMDGQTKTPSQILVNIESLILKKGDIVIICSDGITDFFNDLGRRNDVWNMNENIEKIINDNLDKDVSYINSKLVQRANYNGGWDNISSIMIKIC